MLVRVYILAHSTWEKVQFEYFDSVCRFRCLLVIWLLLPTCMRVSWTPRLLQTMQNLFFFFFFLLFQTFQNFKGYFTIANYYQAFVLLNIFRMMRRRNMKKKKHKIKKTHKTVLFQSIKNQIQKKHPVASLSSSISLAHCYITHYFLKMFS